MHLAARRRHKTAALLDPAEELNLHWPNTGGSNSCHLRHLPESPRGADLRKSDKKVCKYDRPEHEQADVPSKVEGKSGTKHEQDQA